MAGSARPSMQELINLRRHAGFVGRRSELALFRANFDTQPEDLEHRFVFHVHGNAGVGKTTLVREFVRTARERQALTATVDESVNSVPEVLEALADQFARLGHPLKALDRALATYRRRRDEASAASLAQPEQGPTAGSLAVAQAGLVGLGMVPGVGALTGAVDPAQLARGADHVRAALGTRTSRQEDARLLTDPLRVLTPTLVAELDRVASQAPWIAVFFDTYERTGPFLDTWLRDLVIGGPYGSLPANAVITLSGQGPLAPNCWADCADLVTEVPLTPFTESEARQFLTAKGVVDDTVVRDVLRLSRRLPVLLSTLAVAENAAGPGGVDDPSATAVERFLKWEREPTRRAAALAGALPRRLNEDIFTSAVGDAGGADPTALYSWLRTMPFVSDSGGFAHYHDVVRDPMLRLQRSVSPDRWRTAHDRLAESFGQRRESAGAGLQTWEQVESEAWWVERLEEIYHLLCAQPRLAFARALGDGPAACAAGAESARRWAHVFTEAGEAVADDALRDWGSHCLAALGDEQRGVEKLLGMLLSRAELDDAGRALAFMIRGEGHSDEARYTDAFEDFDRAIGLAPRWARPYTGRALVHRALGEYEKALEDHDRAVERRVFGTRPFWHRGETNRLAGRPEAAIADFDQVLVIDPGHVLALASRARTAHTQGRSAAALADLDLALDIKPDHIWSLVRRAQVRRSLDDTGGARADLDRALALSPRNPWIVGERGELLRQEGRFEDAIAEYDRALALDPGYAWAVGSRAMAHEALGRRVEALADLDRALTMKPSYRWAADQRERILAATL
ncbi:tetratricopeptide repeat protein [Streptomyces sp. NBC_00370]|uniref:tetratricopeptide repeat protein n=1 Tax=Streptomyces sp. NBC_00370 TaxID=2975728 RepID=UPI002E269774